MENEKYLTTDYRFQVIRYENADLKSISVSPGIFDEILSAENSTYTVKLKKDISKITFELFPSDEKATISMYNKKTPQKITYPVNNKYDFVLQDAGEDFIAVVKASDGYKRYYTFKVIR